MYTDKNKSKKKRKSEEQKRYDKRVQNMLVNMQYGFDWLRDNPNGAVYIIVSQDDYGHNLEEDWSVSVKAENICRNLDRKCEYYFWDYTSTSEEYLKERVNVTDIYGTPIKTIYKKNFFTKHHDIQIGEVSSSGNHRTGKIFIMGIMLNSYVKEITSPIPFKGGD